MHRLLSTLVLLCVLATPAFADVVEATPGGFQIRFETGINATPEAVWKGLIDVGGWWNMEHSYSREAANLSLDLRPGGCFCEKLANNGGVAHATVVYVAPNSLLRLSGALGPMQAAGLTGSLTFQIVPASPPGSPASRVEMTYSVGGYRPGGIDKLAAPVNGVMGEQFARLKSFIETGKPVVAK